MTGATGEPVQRRRTWERPSIFYRRELKWVGYALILAFFAWSVWGLRVPLERVLIGLESGQHLLAEMLRPDFGSRSRELIWSGVIESLAMSVVATVIGVLLSIPVAFMAARNVSPLPMYGFGRGLVTISRSFHELIVAIIAVKAFGLGAFAGMVTLVFGTIGFYAKLLAEDIEDIDETQIEAMRSTGANKLQVLIFGVLPQVMPRIVGLTVYRFDINIRHSTIVGIVGAGGIGATLMTSFQTYDFALSSAIIIVIVAIVMFGELVSAVVRQRVQ